MKKVMITILCFLFLLGVSLGIVATVFFITPSRSARNSISLPEQVEDPAGFSTEAADDTTTYDNIYIADVYQSLTLRAQPDVNGDTIADLAPMTKMQLNDYVANTSYAYVEVINGEHKGLTGYVNCDYITRWGEPTVRVSYDEE